MGGYVGDVTALHLLQLRVGGQLQRQLLLAGALSVA